MANAGDTDIPVRWLSALDTPLRRVILESPYAGDIERNVAYARAAMRDSLLRGEAPIASHLLYTQPGVLDDQVSRRAAPGDRGRARMARRRRGDGRLPGPRCLTRNGTRNQGGPGGGSPGRIPDPEPALKSPPGGARFVVAIMAIRAYGGGDVSETQFDRISWRPGKRNRTRPRQRDYGGQREAPAGLVAARKFVGLGTNAAKKCKRTAVSTGKPCRHPAMRGSDYCLSHGGSAQVSRQRAYVSTLPALQAKARKAVEKPEE